MYEYDNEKASIFTEEGQVMFLQIRDKVQSLLKQAGAFRLDHAIHGTTGSSWRMLACVDRLVELGEISEVTNKEKVATQYRVFVGRR